MTGNLVMLTLHVLTFILNFCESVCQPISPLSSSLQGLHVCRVWSNCGDKSLLFPSSNLFFLLKHSLGGPHSPFSNSSNIL